jgi:hypothetical protein
LQRCGTAVSVTVLRESDCRATLQTEFPLAERRARVKSFTEDWLRSRRTRRWSTATEFDVGGNLFAEFADTAPGELAVGTEVAFAFRIKDYDRQRAIAATLEGCPVRH